MIRTANIKTMKNLKVYVYYNLHTHKWSIKALEGKNKGRVIAHVDAVQLRDAKGKVSEAGRQRVIQEQRKNVHAGIEGHIVSFDEMLPLGYSVTYNPYKYSTFVSKETEDAFESSPFVYMDSRKVYAF